MTEDIIGKKFGKLLVLSKESKILSGDTLYKCLCDCGNITIVRKGQLKSGKTKSCGCLRKERQYQNLVGQKFNKLTVLKEVGKDKQGIKWLCQCDCGNTTILHTKTLKSGNIKSCGCLSHKHGQFGKRIYQTWADMKRRCYNPSNKSYKYYGALGVEVCQEWKENFIPFYEWAIANGYNDELTIDRINPYGNYEPSNCRWVTREEQVHNTRKNYKEKE